RRVLRLVEGLSGEVEIDVTFKPTFDFARATTSLRVVRGRGVIAESESRYLSLACRGAEFSASEPGEARARLQVAAGQRVWLVLTSTDAPDRAFEALLPSECDDQLARTLE